MNIVICDDDESDILIAKNVIKQTVQELHIKTKFDYYSNATDVERKLLVKKESTDILILDIDMPEVSGMELAEKLRAENTNLIIIFLTNHEEFVFKAFEFQPFRYIRKMKINTELPIAIKSAVKIIKIQTDKEITLNTDDGNIRVMISDIIYYETEKRKIAVNLSNGKRLLVSKKISEMQEIINKNNFIMIHRSCVINADYVKHMNNGIITLKNDEQLITSRRKYRDIKQQILMLWGDKI
ncbi:MAG: LytTR family DNA-binding domain-containing protein [Ruminococcus sp.]|nr:LytTR family DNA-binding domain-containing protein [Ruminococcus sp.]